MDPSCCIEDSNLCCNLLYHVIIHRHYFRLVAMRGVYRRICSFVGYSAHPIRKFI
jgi:hypothetical protein